MIFIDNYGGKKTMNKKLFSLLLIILVFISISTISASDVEEDITIDNSNIQTTSITQSDNEALSDNNDMGTFTELNGLIQNSTTIDLTKDYKYSDDDEPTNFTMNKILTINGNGHKIDGSGLSTGIFIQNNYRSNGAYGLSINNLTITNVNASTIISSGVLLNNVNITNCNANTILNATLGYGTNNLTNCYFISNTAKQIVCTDFSNFNTIDKNVFLNNTIRDYILYIDGDVELFSNNVFINDNDKVNITGDILDESPNYYASYGITIMGPDKINKSSVYTFSLENDNLPDFELMVDINSTYATLNTTSIILGGGRIANVTVTPKSTGSAKLTVGSSLVCNPIGSKEITTENAKIPTNITIDRRVIYLGPHDNVSSGAHLIPANAGLLSFNSSNESVVKVENGNLIAIGVGVANVTVSFAGNENYSAAEDELIIVGVWKALPLIYIEDDTLDLLINTTIPINASIYPSVLNLTFVSSNESVATVDSNGIITTRAVGSANITVSFEGNDRYVSNSETVLVNVRELPEMNITTNDIIVGDNLTITATLSENATGRISAFVNHILYSANITNGSATLIIPNLTPNEYITSIMYSGDERFAPLTKEINATVRPDFNMNVSDVEKYYDGNESLIINCTDLEGNPLNNVSAVISINNRTYNRKIINGTAKMDIKLSAGEYVAYVTVANFTKEAKIIVKTTINATNIEKYFKNATQFYATLLDSEGKPLVNSTAKFNINGIFYERKTNEKGTAKLNINLPTGNYTITTTNPVTKDVAANNVTVLSTVIGNDIVKYFKNGTQYYATFLDEEGNPLTNGTAKFNINGVFYDRKINENGTAKLNINLPPGNYTITAINPINNQTLANNVEVLSTIITSDINMTAGNRVPFVAHIINGSTSSIFEAIETDLGNISSILSKFNITDIAGLNTSDISDLISKISNVTADIKDIADKNNISELNPILDNIKNHTVNFTDIVNAIENGTFADLVNEAAAKLNVTLENLTSVLKNVTDVNGTVIDMNETLAKLANFTEFLSDFKVVNITDFNATKSIAFIEDLLNVTSAIKDIVPSFSNSSSSLISPILDNINISSLDLSNSIKAIDGDALVSLINNATGKLNISLEDLISSISSYGSAEVPVVNATVTFNINGVLYTRKTNATGDAKLNINLPVGDYIITTSYNGLNVANTVKVRVPN